MVEATTNLTEQFYTHLTQSIAEGLLVLDEDGTISSANEAAAAILGYEPDALIGHAIQEFMGDDLSLFEQLQANEMKCNGNFQHRNGRFVPVSLTVSPLAAPTVGNNRLLAITSLDDVQRLNESLSRAQRLASIGTLTASVAHELNTPISIITATCSNLLHEVEDNSLSMAQLLKYVEMIEQSAWRSVRILEVLRNYSYNDAPNFTYTNLNGIVEDSLTLVRHQFRGEFHIKIEKELEEDIKTIFCDHNRMTQVLLNLLNNASDAMEPGGQVSIKSWTMSAPPLDILNGDLSNGKTYLAISVKDSGHGIDDAIMSKIFNPFFTTKPNGAGTGLGLYIAKRVVDQHNGRIWAENNPEGGATFTVVIPSKQ
ncbi:MAG: PAS domain S-box protein [Chloroflexi bacterium]|nr:MAG: PAS domain S-box protein [Chloroflexota bacterium]